MVGILSLLSWFYLSWLKTIPNIQTASHFLYELYDLGNVHMLQDNIIIYCT